MEKISSWLLPHHLLLCYQKSRTLTWSRTLAYSLIGSIYKNHCNDFGSNKLVNVLGYIGNEVQDAILSRKDNLLDGQFILNEILSGVPKEEETLNFKEFQFYKGLKQWGDLLSPPLYTVDGEPLIYLFKGEWSDGNISTLIHVLKCFFHASGLKINLNKSNKIKVEVLGTVFKHGKEMVEKVKSRFPK
ncbi:hypothetical protein Tco_0641173 [Tanacetum coccineum]